MHTGRALAGSGRVTRCRISSLTRSCWRRRPRIACQLQLNIISYFFAIITIHDNEVVWIVKYCNAFYDKMTNEPSSLTRYRAAQQDTALLFLADRCCRIWRSTTSTPGSLSAGDGWLYQLSCCCDRPGQGIAASDERRSVAIGTVATGEMPEEANTKTENY